MLEKPDPEMLTHLPANQDWDLVRGWLAAVVQPPLAPRAEGLHQVITTLDEMARCVRVGVGR
eukprot:CAMPEP_0115690256 /NCGR_PEP_ID=MMETSP0272-20121206/62008_1 /TAXON_ID=71861 /ORGANISM="Scrippsiella trochoidea, Strain CCMP3099" /LENGTH=61 /DNA_ID=CAMNT_0003130121 /DNA_START=558 /DNA_END=740 /DNA_ORIENTATION=-